MLVDVHSHIVPINLPAAPVGEAGRWPCMRCSSGTQATMFVGDKSFRELDKRSWNLEARLADMDRDAISIQVLSPMPELLGYWMNPDASTTLNDCLAASIAEMISIAPNRFRGLGSVPMQDTKLAVSGLERLKSKFGLSGIEIGSNINGAMIGEPQFDPIYEAAESLGLAIFVHALHPISTQAANLPGPFTGFVGFPFDVTMAVASLMMSGTLDRFPGLRIGFSHGGGALGAILGRLNLGWERTKGFGGKAATSPQSVARKLFYDSNVYDQFYLDHLVKNLPGRVFLGTDYPYDLMQREPAAFIDSAIRSPADRDAIRFGAALSFLNEDVGKIVNPAHTNHSAERTAP